MRACVSPADASASDGRCVALILIGAARCRPGCDQRAARLPGADRPLLVDRGPARGRACAGFFAGLVLDVFQGSVLGSTRWRCRSSPTSRCASTRRSAQSRVFQQSLIVFGRCSWSTSSSCSRSTAGPAIALRSLRWVHIADRRTHCGRSRRGSWAAATRRDEHACKHSGVSLMVRGVRIKDHWNEQRLFDQRALVAGVAASCC